MATTVVHAVCAGSLLLQAYFTAKRLKMHVDVVVDRIADVADGAVAPSAGAGARATTPAPSAQRARRRRATMTPQHAVAAARANDEETARLLRFWVLVGLLAVLEAMRLPYAFSARVVLTLIIGTPLTPARWLDAVFDGVARPLLGRHAARAIGALRWAARRAGAAATPGIRVAVAAAVSRDALAAAPDGELAGLRAALERAAAAVAAEARGRTRARLALPQSAVSTSRGVSGGGGGGGDSDVRGAADDGGLMHVSARVAAGQGGQGGGARGGIGAGARVAGVTPLPVSDDDEDDGGGDGDGSGDRSGGWSASGANTPRGAARVGRDTHAGDPWAAVAGAHGGNADAEWLAPLPPHLRAGRGGARVGWLPALASPVPPAPPMLRSVSAPRGVRRRTSAY